MSNDHSPLYTQVSLVFHLAIFLQPGWIALSPECPNQICIKQNMHNTRYSYGSLNDVSISKYELVNSIFPKQFFVITWRLFTSTCHVPFTIIHLHSCFLLRTKPWRRTNRFGRFIKRYNIDLKHCPEQMVQIKYTKSSNLLFFLLCFPAWSVLQIHKFLPILWNCV